MIKNAQRFGKRYMFEFYGKHNMISINDIIIEKKISSVILLNQNAALTQFYI